jgi:hypothetical protein
MPYELQDRSTFTKYYYAKWIRLSDALDFVDELVKTDFSVVAVRRHTHIMMSDMTKNAMKGETFFSRNQIFPNDMKHTYLCTADTELSKLLLDLSASLSYRTSNIAKDTQSTSKGGKNVETEIMQDQGSQDASKSFYELAKRFDMYVKDPKNYIHSSNFENRALCHWFQTLGPGEDEAVIRNNDAQLANNEREEQQQQQQE